MISSQFWYVQDVVIVYCPGDLKTGCGSHGQMLQTGLLDAEHTEEEALSVSVQTTSAAVNDSIKYHFD